MYTDRISNDAAAARAGISGASTAAADTHTHQSKRTRETVPATECIGDLLRGVWLVIQIYKCLPRTCREKLTANAYI